MAVQSRISSRSEGKRGFVGVPIGRRASSVVVGEERGAEGNAEVGDFGECG